MSKSADKPKMTSQWALEERRGEKRAAKKLGSGSLLSEPLLCTLPRTA